jgi:hypothetical protein
MTDGGMPRHALRVVSAGFAGVEQDAERERDAPIEPAFAIRRQVEHVLVADAELPVEGVNAARLVML